MIDRTLTLLAAILLGSPLSGGAPAASQSNTPADSLPQGAVVRLGTISTGDERPAASPRPSSLRGVAFSPDGTLIATRGEPADPAAPRKIQLWDPADGRLVRTIVRNGPVTAMAFSPDGRHLISSTPDHPRGTEVRDVKTGELVAAFPGGRGKFRIAPGGRELMVVDRFQHNDVILTYRVKSGKEIARSIVSVSHHLEFSRDARRLLSLKSERSDQLRLLETKTGRELARLSFSDARAGVMAFSPDGHSAAAVLRRAKQGGAEDIVVLWELASRRRAFELAGHTSRVLSLCFSPDGKFLVTGGADKTVRAWETATGRLVHVFQGHAGPVSAVAVSPDGTRVVSGSFDRTALVWNLSAVARSFLPRAPLENDSFEQTWQYLAAQDPSVAYPAMGRLQAEGDRAAAYVQKRVESILVPVEARRVGKLIADLDHDDYRVRNRATRELTKLVEVARPILLKALEETTSEEVRYRIGRILSESESSPRFSSTDILRMLRVIHVLEHLPSERTEATLELIAGEFPEERVSGEAEQALARLRPRDDG